MNHYFRLNNNDSWVEEMRTKARTATYYKQLSDLYYEYICFKREGFNKLN